MGYSARFWHQCRHRQPYQNPPNTSPTTKKWSAGHSVANQPRPSWAGRSMLSSREHSQVRMNKPAADFFVSQCAPRAGRIVPQPADTSEGFLIAQLSPRRPPSAGGLNLRLSQAETHLSCQENRNR